METSPVSISKTDGAGSGCWLALNVWSVFTGADSRSSNAVDARLAFISSMPDARLGDIDRCNPKHLITEAAAFAVRVTRSELNGFSPF
jgi:hypothetical protein